MTESSSSSRRAFVVWFRNLHRWSVGAFVQTDWHWPAEFIRPLSAALSRKTVDVDRAAAQSGGLRLVTLHFDGEMEPRDANRGDGFKGRLFHADPGDVVYSKIDVRNGAIGIIPNDLGRVCVSSEYPVYTVNPTVAEASYVKLLFRTAAFRRKINSMISGASGRKRVQPTDLETVQVPAYAREFIQSKPGRTYFRQNARTAVGMWKIGGADIANLPIPLPPLCLQRQIVERVAKRRDEIARLKADAKTCADAAKADVEAMILGAKPVE